ncbi:UMP kinase [Buchnera aphidicola]|uniref:UMP kinase n=1 Tax=Buchnera aphidicola TaxID=9 RepID=UPI003463E7EF
MKKNKNNLIPLYRRIILKISGEVLKDSYEYGIDLTLLNRIVKEIKSLMELGIEVGIVVGGGNLIRGASVKKIGISNITSDYMGMLATIINGLVITDTITNYGMKTYLLSAIAVSSICKQYNVEQAINLLSNQYVAVFSGGIGHPFFTTDTTACLRGIEVKADIILKATKVNGVYSSDPKKHQNAIMYKYIKYQDALIESLGIMDQTALVLARDHNLPICVFNMYKSGALHRIVMGEQEGTLIAT